MKMNKSKRALAMLSAAALLMAAAVGCGAKTVESTPTPDPAPASTAPVVESSAPETQEPSNHGEPMEIHVGDFLGETFLYPVKLANELGMFEEEFAKDNITVVVDYLGSGAVMNEALTAGELDMSFLGGQPTFSGIANGNGVKVITMATVSNTDPCLIVRADSDINEVSQLKDKNMAVNIGTDNHYQLAEMLTLGGLVEDDIHLYNMKGNEALAALLSGEIDCMQTIAPNKWQYILDGDVKVLANMSETSGRNNQVLVASPDFMENHGDLIVRFLKVLQKALDYYEANKTECWDTLATYCDAKRELMDNYMDDYDCTLGLTEEDRTYMENVYNFLYDHGMLDTQIDVSTIYNDSFLIEAFGTVDCH